MRRWRDNKKTTHGLAGTRLYTLWKAMKRRCRDPRETNYHKYGAKGVDYCDAWERFEPFCDWALSHGYADHLTLDRIDNAKGYDPSNCRWATPQEQQNNRTNNRRLTAFGETKTIAEWSRDSRCKVKYFTLMARAKKGWDHHAAISSPLGHNAPSHNVTAFGETKLISEWSRDERCAVGYGTLIRRIASGWDSERAITKPARPICKTK